MGDLAQRALQEDEFFVQQLLPVRASGHEMEEDLTPEIPEGCVLWVELKRFHRLFQRRFVVDLRGIARRDEKTYVITNILIRTTSCNLRWPRRTAHLTDQRLPLAAIGPQNQMQEVCSIIQTPMSCSHVNSTACLVFSQ